MSDIDLSRSADYRNVTDFFKGHSDDEIKAAYKSFENRGERFLADWQDGFKIYVMTWAEIFDAYQIRNDFLLSKLKIDKAVIKEELESLVGEIPEKEQPEELTVMIQEEALVAA